MYKKICFTGFYTIFTIMSLWTFAAGYLAAGLGLAGKSVIFGRYLIFLTAAGVARLRLKQPDEKTFNTVVTVLFVCFAAALWVFGLLTMCYPVSDLEVLVEAADYFLEHGDILPYSYYFTICKNTLGNALFIYLMFFPLHAAGINIYSDIAEAWGILVNCLMIVAAVYFAYRIFARIVKNKNFQILFLLICFSYIPFYLWAHRYYSDTLCLPFVTGGMLLCAKADEAESAKGKILLGRRCGACLWLGYFLKGNAAITLAAVVIWALVKGAKGALKHTAACLVTFAVCLGAFSRFINNCRFIDYSNIARDDYPFTMWLMYGAHDDGNYSDEDVNLLASLPDYRTRKEVAAQKLKEYYSAYDIKSFIGFLNHKYRLTYGNGMFDAENYLNNRRRGNFTHYFLIPGMPFFAPMKYLTTGIHLVYMFLTFVGGLLCFKNKKWEIPAMVQLYVLGNIIFFSFWETKARYAFAITPALLILAAAALYSICCFVRDKLFDKNKTRPDKEKTPVLQ